MTPSYPGSSHYGASIATVTGTVNTVAASELQHVLGLTIDNYCASKNRLFPDWPGMCRIGVAQDPYGRYFSMGWEAHVEHEYLLPGAPR